MYEVHLSVTASQGAAIAKRRSLKLLGYPKLT
jgi:hypothetical protein